MAIAYVNSATPLVQTSGTNQSFSAVSLTTGNLIVVQIRWSGAETVASITDTAGNTYAQAGTTQDVAANDHLDIWYAKNVTGNASNVVTINFSGSAATSTYATTAQYSGLDTTSPLDTTAKAVATATSVTSGSFSTAQADEIIVSAVGVSAGNGTTLTPSGTSGSYNKRTMSITGGLDISGIADIIVSSTQSGATATWSDSASDTIGIVVATFRAAAAPASSWLRPGTSIHPGRSPGYAGDRFMQTMQGIPVGVAKFRRTLSGIGTRTGSRQTHNWN